MKTSAALTLLFAAACLSLAPQAAPAQPSGEDSGGKSSIKGGRGGGGGSDLSNITLPDDAKQASKDLEEWLTARGVDVKRLNETTLNVRRSGISTNFFPLVFDRDIDRIRLFTYYTPKDEARDSEELDALIAKLNREQNVLQAAIDGDGDLFLGSYITFYDDLSAKEFDAFFDLHAGVVQKYLQDDKEALDLLK